MNEPSSRTAVPALPSPSAANYLLRRALRAQIAAGKRRHLEGLTDLDILDLGCGSRPYEAIFRPHADTYVGVDSHPAPGVDVVSDAEALPFDDRSFDCVLCTQVLEHVQDPYAVMREVARVLRPGGVAFVSTHGVANYHPNPSDYWRWTHTGLELLFTRTGSWRSIDVTPNGGTATAIAYLAGRQAEVVAARARLARPLAAGVLALNLVSWGLDRSYRRAYPDRPPDLAPNYLVVATRDRD